MPNNRTTSSNSVSRRDLIKTGAAASAVAAMSGAIAAPTIIPSSALGDEKKAAPSERLNIGFIGLGKQNSGHLGAMVGKRDVQVLAICDVDTTRREHFRDFVDKKYGELERKDVKAAKAYEHYQDLLARDDIDGVFIATPDHWHTTSRPARRRRIFTARSR